MTNHLKNKRITKKTILKLLEEVKDPEIPVLSLLDLGVITSVKVTSENTVIVKMTPTFAACPAIDYMKKDIEEVLVKNDISNFKIEVSFETQWNSDMISERGRQALKKFGLAPPPKHNLIVDLDVMAHAICPFCSSDNTVMKTPFGPTLCRAIHYCHNCKQAFEQFKPI